MPQGILPIADQIRARLAGLAPERLEILDESSRHAGHSEDARRGESHFRIRLAAPGLAGQSRLARHRAVLAALGPEITTRVHALAIEFLD